MLRLFKGRSDKQPPRQFSLALQLFRQNADLDSKLNLSAYKIFSQLKVQEFLKYCHSGDYRAYVNLLRSAKDIRFSLISLLEDLSGRLEALEDKAAFIKWFFANQESVVKKLSSAQAVSTHLGDSGELRLREALSQLLEKQGEEFLKSLGGLRSWGYSQNLSQEAFLRVVEFFTAQNQAKRLVKRREIVNLVQYMAESAESRQWQEFLTEFTRIDGSTLIDYTVLFEKYPAAIILETMQTQSDIKTVKIIVETFEVATTVQQKSFLQRLIKVLTDREIPSELVSQLCFHIIKMHYGVADFGFSQLEQERPFTEVIEIINSYKDDQEFRNSPPEVS